MMTKACRCVFGFALVAALGVWARADTTVGSFHRTFSVSGHASLDVSTGAGDIRVTGTPGNTITVDGTIHHSNSFWGGGWDPKAVQRLENNPPIDQQGSQVTVHSSNWGWSSHLWISYVITVPPDADVRTSSGSGDVYLTNLSGADNIHTGSGDVHAADLHGSLEAGTGSGDITFDRIAGVARLSCGSGDITGNEAAGPFFASTGSGDITVHQLDQGGETHSSSGEVHLDDARGDLTVHTASGDVRAGGELTGNHRWNISTSSGDVRLYLPRNTSASVYFDTASGGMNVDFPLTTQGWHRRHHLEGTMGSGSPSASLRISTASGDIGVN